MHLPGMFFSVWDILVFIIPVSYETGIHYYTERPMSISIDWNEDELLLEDVDVLLCSPG